MLGHPKSHSRRLATVIATTTVTALLGLAATGGPATAAQAKGHDKGAHSASHKTRRATGHRGHVTDHGAEHRHRIAHEVVRSGGHGWHRGSDSTTTGGSGSTTSGGSGSTTTSGSGSTTTGSGSTTTTPPPVTTPPVVTPEPPSETPTTVETPTVEPPKVEPPTTEPAGTLLFSGSKIRDFGIEAAPGAVTEVPDPAGSGETVLDMTVNNSDVYPLTPTNNPRAQALTPAIIQPEHEYWLKTKFFIPKGMPYVSGWLALMEIYGAPFAGSSPWVISINEHELRWMRNASHDNDIPWRAPLAEAEGAWTTILLHEKFSTHGFVEMWVNGKQITFFPPGNRNPFHEPETSRLEMATRDASNDGGPNSAKIMQYRMANMFQTASVYFGALKVGTSRASVEG